MSRFIRFKEIILIRRMHPNINSHMGISIAIDMVIKGSW
jgi:hypothetical protein